MIRSLMLASALYHASPAGAQVLTPIDWQSAPTYDAGTGRYTLLGTFGGSGVTATLTWDTWTGATRDLTVVEPFAVWNNADYTESPGALGGPPPRYDYNTYTSDGVRFTASGGSSSLADREFNLTFSQPVDDLAMLIHTTPSGAYVAPGHFSETGYGYTHYAEGSILPDVVADFGTTPAASGYYENTTISLLAWNHSWFMEFADDQLSGVDFAFDLVNPADPIYFQLFAVVPVPEPSGPLLLGLTGAFCLFLRKRTPRHF